MRRIVIVFLITVAVFAAAAGVAPNKGVKRERPALAVESGPECWEGAFNDMYDILFSNLREPNKLFPMRHALPSRIFMGVYLWDTAFIAQVWKPWDANLGQEICSAVMYHSDEGRLQHMVSKHDKSPLTQPAVMAWSVWELYKWTSDREYLRKYYPVLKDYNRWLYENRRLENGLFFWEHPYESGIDNAPRFSSRDESEVVDMRRLAAIDLCSYVVAQNKTLAVMAVELGKADDARLFEHRAEELSGLINKYMWDRETGMYYDLDLNTGEFVRIKTIAGLFPLFANVATEDRAEKLLEHIMNPREFNTVIPFPSVSRDEPSYERDMWRGPVWVNTAYMAIKGMENYGFRREAAELSWNLIDGVYATWEKEGRMYEFYDPDGPGTGNLHRKRGNLYKRLTLGDKPRPNFVGWTGLVNNLLIEDIIGLTKSAGSFRLEPYFPESAAGTKLKLSLPADHIEIRAHVKSESEIIFSVTKSGVKKEFVMASGEAREL